MYINTPYGNATFLIDYLNKGKLITVQRGFHSAKRAMIFRDSLLVKEIYKFMSLDFEKDDFHEFAETLPETFELEKFQFWPISDTSLFDRYVDE